MQTNKLGTLTRWVSTLAIGGLMAVAASSSQAALRIVIANANAPGVGFNDPTPATPVGGNTGTTVGQQRLIAFTYAANIWGAKLTSPVPVVINAQFTNLACTATGATLGSAGATSIFRNFANAPKANTWYSYALANKIAGTYLGTSKAAQINANFNADLGNPTGGTGGLGCLTGSTWYYGLDSNEGVGQIDFVAVLQHEMAHGLGFQTFTSGTSGAYNAGFPAVWDHFLFSLATGKTWADATTTTADRIASSISVNGLVWNGPIVTAAAASMMQKFSNANIGGANAGAAAGDYGIAPASFGALLTSTPLVGELTAVTPSTSEACSPLTGAEATAVNGRIALIARGTCSFIIKVKNAQDAGAIGVLISDNVAATLSGLSGTDPSITIPAARITLANGNSLRAVLGAVGSPTGVTASLSSNGVVTAGVDALGRLLMYAPNPFASGSSVSHFDVSAIPNLLMEPSINSDLTQSVIPPFDLTLALFQEIGW